MSNSPWLRAFRIVFEEAPLLVSTSASCFSLFIHCRSISPFSDASLIAAISTRSLLSDRSVDVVDASNSDILSVRARTFDSSLTISNSCASLHMKFAVSMPSAKDNVSAARVDLAVLRTLADRHVVGQDLLNLSMRNTI